MVELAAIFAKNSKKYFYFGKPLTVFGWEMVYDFYNLNNDDASKAELIHDSLYRPDSLNKNVSYSEVMFMVELSAKAWTYSLTHSNPNHDQARINQDNKLGPTRISLCQKVALFANMFPNDTFSISIDVRTEWPKLLNSFEEVKL